MYGDVDKLISREYRQPVYTSKDINGISAFHKARDKEDQRKRVLSLRLSLPQKEGARDGEKPVIVPSKIICGYLSVGTFRTLLGFRQDSCPKGTIIRWNEKIENSTM